MNEPIKIDPEFQSLIPPLSDEEYKQLEENCKADGILDSLKVWNGILIDGHNRYKISEDNDLNYSVCDVDLPNRESVKAWIARNQLGRRNVDDLTKIQLARIAKPEIEKEVAKNVGGRPKKDEKPDMKSCPVSRQEKRENSTSYKLAKAAGMGEQKFHQGEEILDSGNEHLINQVKSGQKTVNQAWLELKDKEKKKNDLTAKASLKKAEQRHEGFQNNKTVSFEDAKQDKKDTAEIANNKSKQIRNSLKNILFFGSAISGGDMDFSIIKNADNSELKTLRCNINSAISILTNILEIIGR